MQMGQRGTNAASLDANAASLDVITAQLDGLTGPVDVRVDQWGVPHISGQSASDVFTAQGYMVARDRLFQLDLWRRRGLGLMAEVFGAEFVERDAAARQFIFRGAIDEESEAYGPRTRPALEAFVAGINARVDEVLSGRAKLPVEFIEFDYLPAIWHYKDILRIRSHGLFGNAAEELQRAQTVTDFGETVENLRVVREPQRPLDNISEMSDAALFPGALRSYELAKAPASLDPASLDNGEGPPPSETQSTTDGSNNWVVAGSHTQTGRPILASDPHRVMSLPSLRYLAHLTCPEFDVIGAGEPMLPGIALGHNEHVGFGLTIFPTDQEDVYYYDLDASGKQYRHRSGWKTTTEITELIPVRGEADREVTLQFTEHGPITGVSADGTRACAVRAMWLEVGMVPYLHSLRYLDARNADEFEAALEHWTAPTVNQVFADVDGNIGWHACGRVPRRHWDGLTPVPGDGGFEWDRVRDFTEFPSQRNPEQGWWATANQCNITDTADPIAFEWMAPFRHQRLSEVLSEVTAATVADMATLQNDNVSVPAREVIDVLRGLKLDTVTSPTVTQEVDPSVDPVVASALASLLEWDAAASAESQAARLFEPWLRNHLRPRLLAERVGMILQPGHTPKAVLKRIDPSDAETLSAGDPRTDLELLKYFAHSDPDLLKHIVYETLAAAIEHNAVETWGDHQRTWLRHPAHATGVTRWSLDPVPRAGTPDTVDMVARDSDGYQTVGASMRFVLDVGDWDRSLAINTPGQSGDPESPHYADLVKLWNTGQYFPFVYSDEAIAQATKTEFRLTPAR